VGFGSVWRGRITLAIRLVFAGCIHVAESFSDTPLHKVTPQSLAYQS
jgi:hypothetical protein